MNGRSFSKSAGLTAGAGFLLVSQQTLLAHEKWFHKGAAETTQFRAALQGRTLVLILSVIVVTILAMAARRSLGRPNFLPGPVSLGAHVSIP